MPIERLFERICVTEHRLFATLTRSLALGAVPRRHDAFSVLRTPSATTVPAGTQLAYL